MKTSRVPRHHHNMVLTRLEVVVIVAVLAIVFGLMIPGLIQDGAKANRITCNNYLKNIGLAYRIFATDNQGLYPFQIPTNGMPGKDQDTSTSGGTLEFASDAGSAWRHFVVLSNELSSPKLLFCPADKERTAARHFSQFTNHFSQFTDNRFLSYTVGMSATDDRPQSVLSGDRNLRLDGAPLSNVVVSFRSNANVAFDQRIHVNAGNLLLGDGSVQQVTSDRLREQINDAVIATREPHKLVIP